VKCTPTAITEADVAGLRVAVVHYWLVGMRGGEKVLEEILRMFPNADIFTHVADPEKLSPLIKGRRITETFVARLPGARKHYQKYLGFMPRALEELDLRGYDVVISSESGPAKGVIVPPGTAHVCYVHSPMRYIWDHYPDYSSRLGLIARMYFSTLAHRLRQWDVTSAVRVDRFVANSSFVAERVRRYYGREADVVHPPVDLDAYRLAPTDLPRDYYLFVSELVRYKRADLVIEAFRKLDVPLVVVGDGDERKALAMNLPPNVRLLGRVPFGDLPRLYQGARALIFPGEEDFGIVPVEAMACGTPVIAYGRGGVRDSVVDGKTGIFFDRQDTDCIAGAVQRFETIRHSFQPGSIAEHARSFAPERFQRELLSIVLQTIADQSSGRVKSRSLERVPLPV
jgi:glycosyltransferase involved in cell wall biosynthesis